MNKITATVGLVALGAASIQAQNLAPAAGSQEATKPWSISATLRGFYDDNYLTAPSHAERDSLGFEISPSASLNLIRDQTALGLNYVYSGRWYEDRDSNDEDAWDHAHMLNGKLSHAFTPRFKIDLSDSFVIAQEPELLVGENGVLTDSGLRSEGDNMRNHALVSFSAGITENLTAVLGYGNQWYDYEEDGFVNSRSATLDRMEHLASLNLRAVVLPKTVVVGGYQYEVVDYDSDDALGHPFFPAFQYDAQERNTTSHYLYAGVDQGISPTLNASLRAGAQYTEYTDLDYAQEIARFSGTELEEDNWSPYVDGNLTWLYQPGSYAQLGVRHQRAQTDISFVPAADGIGLLPNMDAQSTAIYGSVSHRLWGALIGSAIASFQHNQYDIQGQDNPSENFFMAGLNLTYELNRFVALEAGYNFDWLDSEVYEDDDNRSYKRNRVYVGVRGTY
ncbi:MAG TPA: outer membrane beta-barrel protein [Verrucomicrobiae bacterium]